MKQPSAMKHTFDVFFLFLVCFASFKLIKPQKQVTGSSDYSLSQFRCQLPHQGASKPSSLRKVDSSQTKTDGVTAPQELVSQVRDVHLDLYNGLLYNHF